MIFDISRSCYLLSFGLMTARGILQKHSTRPVIFVEEQIGHDMSEAPEYLKNNDEMTLAEFWLKVKSVIDFLWPKKGWIIFVGLFFGLGGYLKVYRAKPAYTASLTFSLEQGGTGGGLSGLASQFGFSIGSGGDGLGGDNLLSLMKSRRIIDDVLFSPLSIEGNSTLLVNQYVATIPKLAKTWDSLGLYPFTNIEDITIQQDSALGIIAKTLTGKSLEVSKVDKKLSFVTVTYSGHDPVFTKRFVELLSTKASDFYIETKMSNSRANINKLERRVDSVSAELNAAMVGYTQSQDQNQFTVQSVAKVPSMQKQIKVTMLTTLYGELVKNLELSKTMLAQQKPLITIVDRPHYPLRVRTSKAKAALIAAFLGSFITTLFFVGRVFLRDLIHQAKELTS
jgi:uncharacterized protein involved in exopolysaccharide biosynthesis